MRSAVTYLAALAVWSASSLVWGQEPLTWPLTWDDCVREAAQHNPDLAAAEASVQFAGFQHRGSYGNFYPQLSLDSSYTRDRSTRNQNISSDYTRRSSIGLTLSQNLFSGFRDTGQVAQTRAQLEAAGASQGSVKAQVSFDLKSAFAQLLFAQEALQLTETIAARRKENMGMVELRFEAGREHKGSFLRSQANYHEAEFEVEQAKRALVVAQRGLSRALGRTGSDAIRVTGDFDVAPPASAPDFVALARQTPAYLEPKADARAAEAAVTVARSSFFPELSADGSASRVERNFSAETSEWSAGLFLTLPLFTGGQNFYDLQSAKADARRAQEALRSVDDQLLLDLQRAHAGFQDAVGRAAVQQEFLRASAARAEISRHLYSTGLLSFDDWDVIESELISAKKQSLVSLRDRLIAEAAWEAAQGKGAIS
jgi:outer membrane protein TolC